MKSVLFMDAHVTLGHYNRVCGKLRERSEYSNRKKMQFHTNRGIIESCMATIIHFDQNVE